MTWHQHLSSIITEKNVYIITLDAIQHIIKKIKQKDNEMKKNKQLIEHIFPNLGGAIFNAGDDHPLLKPGVPHPDNTKALISVGKHLANIWEERVEYDSVSANEILKRHLNRDICILGSPASSDISKMVLGYDRALSPTSELNKYPIRFEYMPYKHRDDPLFRWVVDPKTQSPKPQSAKHSALVHRNGVFDPILPISDPKTGFIMNDALLITSIANNNCPGTYYVNFAGIHGPGTIAVEAVLQNPKILEQINTGRDGHNNFQSVIKINKILHDKDKKITYIDKGEVEHIFTEPIILK